MKTVFKVLAVLLVLVVLCGTGAYLWASSKTRSVLARNITVHTTDFAIPFPLPDSEVMQLGIAPDSANAIAQARAVERGRHLVQSRYVCSECHGQDFGGGTMVDAPILGRMLGPNITLGNGTRTANYRAADWDRIVRHGVRPDGTPAAMPSQDFALMSDQELSDIVAYIRTMPPVDSTVPGLKLGPLGKMLVATGKLPLAADLIADHNPTHATIPPPTAANVEFGKHMASVCSGCHQPNFAGGPIMGGDPSWPPAKNLTPHPDALGSWTLEHFKTALRVGKRPDNTDLKPPMNGIIPYANKMSDVEIEALYMYLQSLPPIAPSAK
jgi:mono/diheme cytochrome c family protein